MGSLRPPKPLAASFGPRKALETFRFPWRIKPLPRRTVAYSSAQTQRIQSRGDSKYRSLPLGYTVGNMLSDPSMMLKSQAKPRESQMENGIKWYLPVRDHRFG